MDDGSGRFRNNSTDKSSRCRREDNPNKRSTSDHYQRERERHHRKRSRRSYEECSRSYKRPRLDDKPRRSSRLSVGECTLEARRGSSGVRSVAGSQLRRDERERRPASSSFRASKGEGRNQGEVSYKEVTAVVGPWAARLPSSYYYCSGDKVVRGTEKLRELHSKVRNLMLKFTRTVPPECHFLPSLDVESGPEEVSERETPKGVEPKGEHPKQVELNREQPEEVELKGELLENEEQKEKIRREEDPTTVEPKGELSRHDDQNGRVPSLTETEEEEPSKLKKSNDEVTIKEKSEKKGHFEELKKDHKSEAREKVTPFNEHLPVNAPGKVRTVFKMENYSTYGKVSGVDFTAAPPDSWHAYEIRINPSTNFKFGKGLSKITVDGTTFYFQGFTILSPHAQEKVPKPTFTRYGGSYRIEMVVNQVHKNYTLGDVLLFEEYFFGKLLEMYDWIEYMKPFNKEVFFIPRFCHRNEILSLAEVLSYLVESFGRVRRDELLDGSHLEGMLVALPDKAPSCVRIDSIRCYSSRRHSKENILVEHSCSQLQRKARNYTMESVKDKKRLKDLELKREQRKLSQREHFELRSLQTKLNISESKNSSIIGEDHVVALPWKELYTVGLFYDIPQNTLFLPFLTHHLFFMDSLSILQDRLGYKFKDVSLLQRALVHPSCNNASFIVCEDHTRTAISNCGARSCQFLKDASRCPRPAKGMKGLLETVKKGLENVDQETRLQNNEQLEFLGDAVLEYICSRHLFGNHYDYGVGKLTHERQLLVKNKNLTRLADRLKLTEFLLKNNKADFAEGSSSHISGNCVEAILGAVFLDGGLEEADQMFAELAFPEEEKRTEWQNYGTHPLIEEFPDGDRHLIGENSSLKKLESLEERSGEQFKHIRLLAKAFTHSSCNDKSLTGGDYQRLEYLGDAILQFLTSKFVYHHFPAHNEGHLSLLRTSLVHNKQLSVICQELGLQECVITNETEKLELSIKIMADVVESYLGALTLEKGLDKADAFLKEHLFPKLKDTVVKSQLVDSTTRLNQAAAFTCKKQGLALQLPVFKLVSQEGTSDKPIFTVAVHFGKRKLGAGTGSTMRDARSNASEAALQSGILRIPPD